MSRCYGKKKKNSPGFLPLPKKQGAEALNVLVWILPEIVTASGQPLALMQEKTIQVPREGKARPCLGGPSRKYCRYGSLTAKTGNEGKQMVTAFLVGGKTSIPYD